MKKIVSIICCIVCVVSCLVVPVQAEEGSDIVCTHEHTEMKKENVVEATCLTEGSYDEVVYCTDCLEVVSTTSKVTSALGHAYKTTVTKATRDKNGKKVKVCSRCNTVDSSTIIYKVTSFSLSYTSYVYNKDKVRTPKVTVKNSKGNTLVKNTDYTVTYPTGRKNVGKYKIVVKGKGNYSFTKYLYFTIKPQKTTLVSLTPSRGRITVTYNKKTLQTTGYQIEYATNKSFKNSKRKRVTSYKTTSTSISGLRAKQRYYVRMRTYKSVNGTNFYSGWSGYKSAYVKSAYVINPNSVTCLVNKDYYLKDSYYPSDLVSIGGGHKLRKEAASAYTKMKNACNNDGIYIQVVSSVRTKSYQAGLYNNYVASDPYNAPYYSAKPRTSEHEMGLAIDISNNGTLSNTLHQTALGRWMDRNAYKYGFILRYPSDGVESTGYMFEPWHYRYVGVELATKLHKSGQTLEQYYGYK